MKEGEVKGEANDAAKREERRLLLNQEGGGQSISQFFVHVQGDAHSITELVEESPKKMFPHLRDADSLDGGRGWIALTILQADPERTAGHTFIQKFRGVCFKTAIKTERTRQRIQRERAFQFIIIGERPCVQYMKSVIEVNSIRVPLIISDKKYEP
jgi:hypothetical protein